MKNDGNNDLFFFEVPKLCGHQRTGSVVYSMPYENKVIC